MFEIGLLLRLLAFSFALGWLPYPAVPRSVRLAVAACFGLVFLSVSPGGFYCTSPELCAQSVFLGAGLKQTIFGWQLVILEMSIGLGLATVLSAAVYSASLLGHWLSRLISGGQAESAQLPPCFSQGIDLFRLGFLLFALSLMLAAVRVDFFVDSLAQLSRPSSDFLVQTDTGEIQIVGDIISHLSSLTLASLALSVPFFATSLFVDLTAVLVTRFFGWAVKYELYRSALLILLVFFSLPFVGNWMIGVYEW